VELGVQVRIVDGNRGWGTPNCQIAVTFISTGTGRPLPLQQIALQNSDALRIGLSDSSVAEFKYFLNDSAIFVRNRNREKTPATVTLKLYDSGAWYTYTSSLAVCESSAGIPEKPKYSTEPPLPQLTGKSECYLDLRRYIHRIDTDYPTDGVFLCTLFLIPCPTTSSTTTTATLKVKRLEHIPAS